MRKTAKIKAFDFVYEIQALLPIDFCEKSLWPFSYYQLEEKNNNIPEIKRQWNLLPKDSAENDLNEGIKTAICTSLKIYSDKEYQAIKENENLHAIILSEIYALSYELNNYDMIYFPFKKFSRKFAEALAIKAKALNVEPYSFLADLSKEQPELYNPKRYDFNWFILGIGWEREKREVEKQQAQFKSNLNKYKSRAR